MIFVTVGTHEQPFDRLVSEIDRLKGENAFPDEVIVQTGYCKYRPKYCKCFKFLDGETMSSYCKQARIIITHGAPSSIDDALKLSKVPVVVPRRKRFLEHVNDHQFEFCHAVKDKKNEIIVVDDVSTLGFIIKDYDSLAKACNPYTGARVKQFNEKLIQAVKQLF